MTGIKVFLSHKREDAELAEGIARRLRIYHGIDSYLDVIDPRLDRDVLDLAEHIRAEMEKCTQLLAVLSAKTTQSQWVPWEIGVASEKERPLASFIDPPAVIPEFLQKWPYLQTPNDIDQYAEASKTTRTVLLAEQRTTTASIARRTAFREFHRSLKSRLGQQ